MNFSIRNFKNSDSEYEAAVRVANLCYPEYPDTGKEWRHQDETRSEKVEHQRYVAVKDEQIIGVAVYFQPESMYHPQKFGGEVMVHPDHRNKGVGTALYDHLLRGLEPFDPILVWGDVREDNPAGLRFVELRGYAETMREWENHLVPSEFDPAPWEGKVERVEASGIELRTFGELRDRDEQFMPRLFDMVDAASRDVPSTYEHTTPEFEVWVKKVESNPNLIPDGYFIAVDGNRYVGLSTLSKSQTENFLYTGLTGIRREYRRRGVALGAKAKGDRVLPRAGCPLGKDLERNHQYRYVGDQ